MRLLVLLLCLATTVASAQWVSPGSRAKPRDRPRTDVLDACSSQVLGHLICNGAYDNTASLQALINAQSVAAIPYAISISGKVGIASSVTLKANTVLVGNTTGVLKALSGATTLLSSSANIDNISIRGIVFDLNSVATARAVALTGQTTNVVFADNRVFGAATASDSAHYLVEIRCGTTGVNAPCQITGNNIKGSNTAAKNDTCLGVLPTGLIGGDASATIGLNVLHKCGGACLELESGWSGAIVTGNGLNVCKTATTGSLYTRGGSFSTGVISGNIIYSDTADGIYSEGLTNVTIEVNHIQVAAAGKAAVHAVGTSGGSSGGVRILANYAANGVWLDAKGKCATGANNCLGAIGTWGANCACDINSDCQNTDCGTYSTSDHDEIAENIFSIGAPTSGASVVVENASDVNIHGNTDISTTTTAITRAGIKIANYGGSAAINNINIANNVLKLTKSAGTIYGIQIARPQGTGPIDKLSITQNYLGTTDVALEVDNTPSGYGWLIKGNNVVDATRSTNTGWATNIDFAFPIDDMPSFIGIDRNLVCTRDQGVAAASTLVALRCTSSATDPTSYGTVRSSTSPVIAGDFVSGDQSYTSITTTASSPASGDNAGFVWPTASATPNGVQRGWKPRMTMVVQTPATVTSGRWWCGWFSDTTTTYPASNDPSGASAIAFRFDTATDGTTIRAYSNDGTSTGTSSDTTITFAASTRLVLEIDCSNTLGVTPDCDFYAQGYRITRTTDLPATTTNLGFLCGVTTLTSATRTLELGTMQLRYAF